MEKLIRYTALFAVGGGIYSAVEILFRGYTHWTMTVAGGTCLALINLADIRLGRKSIFLKGLFGAGIITAVEFLVGVVVNIFLRWNVWDYSSHPLNIMGQVCPLFTLFWYFLSFPALFLCRFLRSKVFPTLSNKRKPVQF